MYFEIHEWCKAHGFSYYEYALIYSGWWNPINLRNLKDYYGEPLEIENKLRMHHNRHTWVSQWHYEGEKVFECSDKGRTWIQIRDDERRARGDVTPIEITAPNPAQIVPRPRLKLEERFVDIYD